MIKNWTGKILVSTPKMGMDSEFSKSVILLYEESAEHVAGIILNKPGTTKAKKIFQVKGFKTPARCAGQNLKQDNNTRQERFFFGKQ